MTKPKKTESKKPKTKTTRDRSAKQDASKSVTATPKAAKPATTTRSKKPRTKEPTETERQFDAWMFVMDDALEEFMTRLPNDVRRELDYSAASLDVLEAWLIRRYPDIDAAMAETDRVIFDGVARYLGETWRKTLGATWWVDPKGKIFDGLPHVGRSRADTWSIVPLPSGTTATDRQTGHHFSKVWRFHVSWIVGKAERSPFLDHAGLRKRTKVTYEENRFRHWLTMMDRAQDELLAELPEALRDRLDYSPCSLDVVEAWLLARYPDGDAARADTEVLTMDGVARYVGETFRRNLGGAWWFDLEGWSHNALPQIRWPDDGGAVAENGIMPAGDASNDPTPPMCPLALAREAIDARRGDALADAFAAKRAALPAAR